MTVRCSACTRDLRAGARFCDSCGNPVAPVDELGETSDEGSPSQPDSLHLESKPGDPAAAFGPSSVSGSRIASSRLTQLCDLIIAGDWERYGDAIAEAIVSEDRSGGSTNALPLVRGRDNFVSTVRAFEEAGSPFTSYTLDVMAERGERLVITDQEFFFDGGFSLPRLTLAEFDRAGRLSRLVFFDREDLASAHEELDADYLRSEGAAAPRAVFEFAWALNSRDWARVLDLLDPRFHMVDHEDNTAPPSTSPDDFVHRLDALVHQVPDVVLCIEEVHRFSPDVICATLVRRGRLVDGEEVEWRQIATMATVDGRIASLEAWGAEDLEPALVRFGALSAAGGAPA